MRPRVLARAFVLPVLIGTLALAGCDSSDDGGDDGGTFSLRANGTLVEFDGASAGLVDGRLSVGAASAGGSPSAGFLVPDAAGTYSVAGGDVFAFYQNAAGTSYVGVTGTVTVQTLTATQTSGTFSFEGLSDASGTVSVTQGRFDVPVVDVPTRPAGGR